MRKLISNSTNQPLTSEETKKVVITAAAISTFALGYTFGFLRSMVNRWS